MTYEIFIYQSSTRNQWRCTLHASVRIYGGEARSSSGFKFLVQYSHKNLMSVNFEERGWSEKDLPNYI